MCPARLAGQSVEIHSEFQRIDPFGQVVEADRSSYPREILSPEVPRNAHTVFHVAVTLPPQTSYFLYVGSNPPNLIQTTMYKEDFERVGEQWIPDALTPVRMPAFGFMPDAAAAIPGQTTRCYLLDIWVPPNADVRRVRVEVLLKVGIWYVAPMELRLGEARVPPHTEPHPRDAFARRRPDVATRIDQAATDCLSRYLLGQPQEWTGEPIENIRDVIRRSAEQDMAIVRQHYPKAPQALWFLAEDGILQNWMRNPAFPHWSGAEWYLKVRDWIYRNVKQT